MMWLFLYFLAESMKNMKPSRKSFMIYYRRKDQTRTKRKRQKKRKIGFET